MESASFPFPRDIRWRRLLGVALFLGLLWTFRSLAPVLICFVVFERGLGFASTQIATRTRIHRKGAIAALLALGAAMLAVLGVVAVNRLVPFFNQVRTEGRGWVENVAHGRLVRKVQELLHLDAEMLTTAAKDYALTAVGVVTTSAYLMVFLFLGFLLALLYLFEREEVDAWSGGLSPTGIGGTLMRWLGYVADAIGITVRLQVVVAVVNAVFTLPILIGLGLPQIPLLFMMVVITGLLPVVGNVISGTVLCIVAYDAKGMLGVGIFLGVTFLLGKIESYYLSPRLTAQHVKLPGIVLVVSLLLFETVFGFWGLFLSFPALYVASRIASEWRVEEARLEGVAVIAVTAAPVAPPEPEAPAPSAPRP